MAVPDFAIPIFGVLMIIVGFKSYIQPKVNLSEHEEIFDDLLYVAMLFPILRTLLISFSYIVRL